MHSLKTEQFGLWYNEFLKDFSDILSQKEALTSNTWNMASYTLRVTCLENTSEVEERPCEDDQILHSICNVLSSSSSSKRCFVSRKEAILYALTVCPSENKKSLCLPNTEMLFEFVFFLIEFCISKDIESFFWSNYNFLRFEFSQWIRFLSPFLNLVKMHFSYD